MKLKFLHPLMTAMALSVGIASFAQTEFGTWKGFRQSQHIHI
jgi:hypothetical protein